MNFKVLMLALTCLGFFACSTSEVSNDFVTIKEQLNVISELPVKSQRSRILGIIKSNPLKTHEILLYAHENGIISPEVLTKVAKNKRISLVKLTREGTSPFILTPLYHSASVSIKSESNKSKFYLKFRPKNTQDWSSEITLSYDSVSQSFTGNLLNLEENTLYEVLVYNDGYFKNKRYTFLTKKTPLFTPKNIFYLSDIYQGGVLDLVKLGIKGSENNWIKIIGDKNTVISVTDSVKSAINIGDNSYIYFENITIKGGGVNAISSNKGHHLWFDGCDISNWGREARYFKRGKAYASEGDNKPINYDSAFSLIQTGVVTIENCNVHSPRTSANSWRNGHPYGPNAVLVDAGHPNPAYQGQIVIRNNRFYGSEKHRFNDVIESRNNGSPFGGFVRDSAIYNNYLAYANDDIIELDGSQFNVLVYNNEIEQGYCGISAIPNRQGPTFIFNNYIHNLGDENGTSWAAIKLGGLLSRPVGKTNIFNNLIKSNSNGIASANYAGDSTFWADIQSNLIISSEYKVNGLGYGILEKQPFAQNTYINNYVHNSVFNEYIIRVDDNELFSLNNYHDLPIAAEKIGSGMTLYDESLKVLNNTNVFFLLKDKARIGLYTK